MDDGYWKILSGSSCNFFRVNALTAAIFFQASVFKKIHREIFIKWVEKTKENHVGLLQLAVFFTVRKVIHVYYALVIARSFRKILLICRLNFNVENPVFIFCVDIESHSF